MIGDKNNYKFIIDWLRPNITEIMAEESLVTVVDGDEKQTRVDVDLVEGGGDSAFITASASTLSGGSTGVNPAGAAAAGTVTGASAAAAEDELLKNVHAATSSGKIITTGENPSGELEQCFIY